MKEFKYPWWKNLLRGVMAVVECLLWAFSRPAPRNTQTRNLDQMDADNDAFRFKGQSTGGF